MNSIEEKSEFIIKSPTDNLQLSIKHDCEDYFIRRKNTIGYWSDWFKIPEIAFHIIFIISKINKNFKKLFGG